MPHKYTNYPGGITTGAHFKADDTILPGSVVYINGNGRVEIASSATTALSSKIMGIVEMPMNSRGYVDVVFSGVVSIAGGLDINKPLFLGLNGTITQEPPTSGFIKVLGCPIDENSAWIAPETSIILV